MRYITSAILLTSVFVVAAFFVAMAGSASEQSCPPSSAEKTPVLVELFTSEGCSSCPPADRLLIELEQRQPVPGAEVIALGQHVDYWDGLGWRDRFSSAQFTDRQRGYSRNFGEGRVYTPQMVVDGSEEFVGSDSRQARQSIQRAAARAKAVVRLEPAGPAGPGAASLWKVRVDKLPSNSAGRADVYLAVTESDLANQVARGENSGHLLQHTSVVRLLKKIGSIDVRKSPAFEKESDVALDSGWQRAHLRLVAFVQESPSGHVLGAASHAIAAE